MRGSYISHLRAAFAGHMGGDCSIFAFEDLLEGFRSADEEEERGADSQKSDSADDDSSNGAS
jgi:hypothetical protein